MKSTTFVFIAALIASSANAFAPLTLPSTPKATVKYGIPFVVPAASSSTALFAKYKDMDEILALFPDDKPVLINFYDGKTEDDIKDDIMIAKTNLKERCSFCSIRVQDYPDLAKLWDADLRSPTMILFRDGRPLTRLFELTDSVDIMASVGKFC